MGKPKAARKRKRLTTRAAFQGYTGKVHVVGLDDAVECLMRTPTIAQIKAMDAEDDPMVGLGQLIASLVVDEKGDRVFESADQAEASFTVDQLEAFGDFVSNLGDSTKAAKN